MQETSKGQEKTNNLDEGGGATFSKRTEYTGKKAAEAKIEKQEKKLQEASSKTKSTEEKVNSDAKAPKRATRSSSQLISLPMKLRNYFTGQDEEYFTNQETDDVFVSEKYRKKYWNQKERRVCPEQHVMFVSFIASHFCFSIALYRVVRLCF